MTSAHDAQWRLSAWWNDSNLRHAAFVFAGTMSFNASSFLMYVILGRLITVREYGELLSLLSIIMIVSVPAGLLQPVITRVAAEMTATGDRSAISCLAQSLTWPLAIVALTIVVGSTVARDLIAAYFHIERPMTVVCSGLLLATAMPLPIQRAILQGGQRYGEYSLSQIIEAAVKLVIVPAFALVGFGVSGTLVGYVVAVVTATAFNAWMLRLRFGRPKLTVVIPWRRFFIGARRTALVAFTLAVLSLYDVVIVKHVFDPQGAGIYSAAAVVGRALLAIVGFIPALIFPKVSLAFARGEATAQFLRGGLLATLVPIILTLLLVVSVPGLILRTLAGSAFSLGAPLVVPLSMSAALLAIVGTLSAYLMARKSFDFVMPLCGFALIELIAVTVWHPSLVAVARTVSFGHAALLLSIAIATAWHMKKIAIGIVPQESPA